MKILNSFNPSRLDEIFRNHLSISKESVLEYSEKECDWNQCASSLEVKTGSVNQEYLLFKVYSSQLNGTQLNSSLLSPEFIIENDNQETYGAFRKQHLEQYSTLHSNHLEQLKIVLKTLAEIQTSTLVIDEESSNENNLRVIMDKVIALEHFKNIDNEKKTKALGLLERKFHELSRLGLATKSIWSTLGNNVHIRGNDCIFLQLSSEQQKWPLGYDALLYIFSLTDEKFRQTYFEDLISYYFDILHDTLKKENNKLYDEVNRSYAEFQVEVLLPIIKCRLLDESFSASIPFEKLEELLRDIAYYFKYPSINKEDVNEATKNYFSSSDYELFDYQLVPLDTKNGHLGEYFHLRITANFRGEKQQLKLFAKILMSDNVLMQAFANSKVSEKEDFLYKILYPLLRGQGLEEILDFAPKCYLSRLSGILILDDLSDMGYSGLKPNNVLNVDGQQVILKKLAKFHVASLILEENLSRIHGKEVRLGDIFAEYLNEPILICNDGVIKSYEECVTSIQYVITKSPSLAEGIKQYSEDELYEKLRGLMLSPFSRVKRSSSIRNVINHGDMYVANMLFKFGANESIDDGILIDFQMLRYVPPAYEVLFFIFLNSTKDTRNEHLDMLLNWYFENVSSHLKKFNLDPEEIFPRKQFYQDIRDSKCSALATAFNYAHVTHADPDFREEIFHDAEKIKYYFEDNKKEFIDICWKKDHYRNIVSGLVEECVNLLSEEI